MKRSFVLVAIAIGALACQGPRGPATPQAPPSVMGGSQAQTGVSDPSPGPGPGAAWVSLRDIRFDYDNAEIRSSEMKKISEIATYLNDNPKARLGIDGTTDLRRGTNKYNVSLSAQREANVRDALIRAGVPTDKMQIGSFAAERSLCTNRTEDCAKRDGSVQVLASS